MMKYYEPTIQQKCLLQSSFNTSDLSVLQIKSVSKIQLVSFKGITALKSLDDNFQKIRIVIVALLVKIFISYSQQNSQRLKTLKKIIYSSKLNSIVEQKGIQRNHLLKSVAEQFSSLQIYGECQANIIKLFNSSPFYDRILFQALKQRNPLMIQNSCQIKMWLQRQMFIKLQQTQSLLIQESQSQLFLIGIGQEFHANIQCKCSQCNFKSYSEYLRFSTQNLYENRPQAQEIFSQNHINFERNQQIQSSNQVDNKLYTSVLSSSAQLTNSHLLKEQGEKEQKTKNNRQMAVGLFDSVNSQSFPRKLQNFMDDQISLQNKKKDKIKRGNKQNEQSLIWRIFCCNF